MERKDKEDHFSSGDDQKSESENSFVLHYFDPIIAIQEDDDNEITHTLSSNGGSTPDLAPLVSTPNRYRVQGYPLQLQENGNTGQFGVRSYSLNNLQAFNQEHNNQHGDTLTFHCVDNHRSLNQRNTHLPFHEFHNEHVDGDHDRRVHFQQQQQQPLQQFEVLQGGNLRSSIGRRNTTEVPKELTSRLNVPGTSGYRDDGPKRNALNAPKYNALKASKNYLGLRNALSISKAHEDEIEEMTSGDSRFEYQVTDEDPTQPSFEVKGKESKLLFGKEDELTPPSTPGSPEMHATPSMPSTPSIYMESPPSTPTMNRMRALDDSPLVEGERVIRTEVSQANPDTPLRCSITEPVKKEKKGFFARYRRDKKPKDKKKKPEEVETPSNEDVLSNEGKHSMKVISELLNKLFGKKKYGTVTIFMGLALLHSIFATAAYGRKLYYGLMERKLFKGALGTDSLNTRVVLKHTGVKKEDILSTKWYSSKYSPGHFIAIDHETKSVVLSIRGTFNHFDVITDLVAKAKQYRGGVAHLGMILCAHKKMKETEAILLKALHANQGYRLIVTGHSLGAGVGSVFTFLFYDAHPEIPIHCYAFGPPCILSYELATHEIVQSLVTSFCMNDDIVPRLSFCSLFYLREVLDSVLSQSKTKIQRGFHIVSAGNGLGDNLTKRISKVLKVSPTIDLSHVEHNPSGEVQMYPPGRLVRMVKMAKNQYVAERVDNRSFDKILVSVSMFTDHMPQKYERGLESSILNVYNKAYTAQPPSKEVVEGRPAGETPPQPVSHAREVSGAAFADEMDTPPIPHKDILSLAPSALIPTSLKASVNTGMLPVQPPVD
eukprot:gene7865-9233_t